MPVNDLLKGRYTYEFVIGWESDSPGIEKTGWIRIDVSSQSPMSYGQARQAAYEQLARDNDLRAKYGMTSQYILDLDKSHLLRVYYGE